MTKQLWHFLMSLIGIRRERVPSKCYSVMRNIKGAALIKNFFKQKIKLNGCAFSESIHINHFNSLRNNHFSNSTSLTLKYINHNFLTLNDLNCLNSKYQLTWTHQSWLLYTLSATLSRQLKTSIWKRLEASSQSSGP